MQRSPLIQTTDSLQRGKPAATNQSRGSCAWCPSWCPFCPRGESPGFVNHGHTAELDTLSLTVSDKCRDFY